ncbi:FN3 associated domain-containing protein [uncultured Sphaerochaeta sp.]|uniref:FN3 associated domain-containing protein n=1 Tax=uncultured Sphaerochaeta sp. TaxID=886478 RepID=UPI002A0A89A0|nr:FN3 associated domain-containing protein [uncultured Sphaerochaeta sp.]
MNHAKHTLQILIVGLVVLFSNCSQEMDFFADTPYTFSYELLLINNQNYVKISPYAYPNNQGYKCFYTLDGSNPIENGIEYTEPIQIESTTTIKTVLKKNQKVFSLIDTHVCELTKSTKPRLDLPNEYFTNNREYDSIIQINNSTWSIPPGTNIELNIFNETEVHYTLDGTTPTLESPKYNGQILIENPCTLKARSYPSSLAHFGPSDILSVDFVARLKKPVFSVESTQYMYDETRPEIHISSPDNAYISYILNSNNDVLTTPSRFNYTGAINLDQLIRNYYSYPDWSYLTKTFKITAVATGKDGYRDSLQATNNYPIVGEAGGFLVYDKGEYSEGWRYLEVTPNQVRASDGGSYCETYEEEISSGFSKAYKYVFGYNKSEMPLPEWNNTDARINTENLVNWYGEEAFISPDSWNMETTPNYALRLCSELSYNGYDDWYLPTYSEGKYIQDSFENGLMDTSVYWFWAYGTSDSVYVYRYHRGWSSESQSLGDENCVLAVRRF